MLTFYIVLKLILIVVLLVVLFAMFVWMYSGITSKVPFISVPHSILPDIEKALELEQGSVVYDLGCGDARVLRYLAKRNPKAKFIGIENGVFPYHLAKVISWGNKLIGRPDNIEIIREDFFDYNLSDASHIFVYLYPNIMDDMLGKLTDELKSGTRVVSASFKFTQKPILKEIDLHRGKMQITRHLIVYEF